MSNKKKCVQLTNFWKEGDYISTIFSIEDKVVAKGPLKIEYLYKNKKIYAVQFKGSSSLPSYEKNIIYYCNGDYKYTDTNGSLYTGTWVYKNNRLCTLIKGSEPLIGLSGKGKIIEYKDGKNYKGEIFISDKCSCLLNGTFNVVLLE